MYGYFYLEVDMKKHISIRLDDDVLKWSKYFASCDKKTFTQFLTDVLWEYKNNRLKKENI